MNLRRVTLLVLMLTLAGTPASAASCSVAEILFGRVSLDIVARSDYETAIVRSATFDNPKKNYGAILGEITVDRGGFSVRDANQVVVGVISPKLVIEGWDDSCDKRTRVVIRRVQPGTYVIMNGDTPVGTIEGRLPKNTFGVR
jgi:hypothetical protein